MGIRVNFVSPGPIRTGWIDVDLEQQLKPNIPLRRVETRADLAEAVVFLASDQSGWITGQVLRINGGPFME